MTASTPTAGQIAAALAGVDGAVPVRFSWQRRTVLNQFRDDISAAVYDDTVPRLTLDNSRAVLRDIARISFRVNDLPDDFNPDSDIIAVVEQRFILGAWRDFPLGLFRLDVGETIYGEDGAPVVECDASDLVLSELRARRLTAQRVAAPMSDYLHIETRVP